jgi:MFS family permease
LVFNFLQVGFASLVGPSLTTLALSQVPKSRGSMMSLFRATNSLARSIATAVGGALLVLTFGFYGAVGLALGGMSLAGTVILLLFAKDSTRT